MLRIASKPEGNITERENAEGSMLPSKAKEKYISQHFEFCIFTGDQSLLFIKLYFNKTYTNF